MVVTSRCRCCYASINRPTGTTDGRDCDRPTRRRVDASKARAQGGSLGHVHEPPTLITVDWSTHRVAGVSAVRYIVAATIIPIEGSIRRVLGGSRRRNPGREVLRPAREKHLHSNSVDRSNGRGVKLTRHPNVTRCGPWGLCFVMA